MSDKEYRTLAEEQKRRQIARGSTPVAAEMSDREKSLASRAAQIGGRVTVGERAERLAKAEIPFVRMAGYVVRGSDESSFVKCGDPGVHYTRMSQMAVSNVVQRYRFRAPRPLSPVYFEIKGRILDDTIKVGDHAYTSVVEIESVYPDNPDARPACAAPPRGSLVERQVSGR
jgi:hypothetical protein